GQADFRGFASRYRTVLDEAHFADGLRLPPRNALPNLSLRRTTVSARLAANGLCLPPEWQVAAGERDDVRYLW
ncbi:MAG TPA: hypothetical protein VNP92_33175, partial [Actinophytocola sp.]|nr:hypothetical protein [Actinophytocola sp.]